MGGWRTYTFGKGKHRPHSPQSRLPPRLLRSMGTAGGWGPTRPHPLPPVASTQTAGPRGVPPHGTGSRIATPDERDSRSGCRSGRTSRRTRRGSPRLPRRSSPPLTYAPRIVILRSRRRTGGWRLPPGVPTLPVGQGARWGRTAWRRTGGLRAALPLRVSARISTRRPARRRTRDSHRLGRLKPCTSPLPPWVRSQGERREGPRPPGATRDSRYAYERGVSSSGMGVSEPAAGAHRRLRRLKSCVPGQQGGDVEGPE